jgi:predicted DCC family thiol-disulfide oxidoreductase YuxK
MSPVLLYDGTCGFCAASVQLVLRHDPAGALRFAPLEGDFARGVLAQHPALARADSIVWIDDHHVLTRSAAALRVARYLGGWWRLALIAWIVPRPLRDAVYRFIAKHRHELSRRNPQCFTPAPADRARFLP